MLEEILNEIDKEIQVAAKWKARYEGKIEALGCIRNRIECIKKNEKTKNDNLIDALRYSAAEILQVKNYDN